MNAKSRKPSRQSRFDKLKEAELNRGREEDTAIDVAAAQVKEFREREGRGKADSPTSERP
jgi:hypothetical protein